MSNRSLKYHRLHLLHISNDLQYQADLIPSFVFLKNSYARDILQSIFVIMRNVSAMGEVIELGCKAQGHETEQSRKGPSSKWFDPVVNIYFESTQSRT